MSGCLFKVHDHFIELIYQVTRQELARRGLASKIMGELIKYSNSLNKPDFKIKFIVTYADNTAIQFFEKNGFFQVFRKKKSPKKHKRKIKKIDERCPFDVDELQEQIEHYNHATLMCYSLEAQTLDRDVASIVNFFEKNDLCKPKNLNLRVR